MHGRPPHINERINSDQFHSSDMMAACFVNCHLSNLGRSVNPGLNAALRAYCTHNKTNAVNAKSRSKPPLPFDAIPGPKPSFPLVGTNWIYFPYVGRYHSMKLHDANMDKFRRYGPIMREELQRGFPYVTVFEPSDIKEIFTREEACPSRPSLPYITKHRKSDPTRYPNVGLANMMGREWLDFRSQLAPLLLSKELKKKHIGTQNNVSTRLVKYIDRLLSISNTNDKSASSSYLGSSCEFANQGAIVNNIQEVFYRYSAESIMNLCIDRELGCLDATGGDIYGEAMKDGEDIFAAAMGFFEAQHQLYYGLDLWKYFNTKPYRQLCDSQDTIHDIASKYIDTALNHLKARHKSELRPDKEYDSLLETLFNAGFHESEIKSTIVDFVSGGIFTVANTLTLTLFLLASNPKVQEQLYQEICHVFGDEHDSGSDITIDIEKLDQLKFLKLCLKESHRLLPTIPGVARTLQKDLVLSNYLVPKNTLVFCNFTVTCRLPQYFEDPEVYNPSRWERTGKNKGDLAFCLLPFGHGVRKCIGHNFAEMEIYVALAKMIRKFRVETIDNQNASNLDLSFKFIIVPEKPVSIKFIPRE